MRDTHGDKCASKEPDMSICRNRQQHTCRAGWDGGGSKDGGGGGGVIQVLVMKGGGEGGGGGGGGRAHIPQDSSVGRGACMA